ncbi:MAG TPA: hypothetical protein VND93_22920 [Myxococcales bacterium]|nr:hypothetical protein [Myxococcales bacterium]
MRQHAPSRKSQPAVRRQAAPPRGPAPIAALVGRLGNAGMARALRLMQAAPHVARSPDETRAEVHQRVLKEMIKLVKDFPTDGEDRLKGLTDLFRTVPDPQVGGLFYRLHPGAPTDDFAQYFKNNFGVSRKEGLLFLRNRMPASAIKEADTPSPPVSSEVIGKGLAVAGCSLPSKASGAPEIPFGMSMEGAGWLFNPKYWVVEYILKKSGGGDTRTFRSSPSQPSAWNQTTDFLDNNADWRGSTLDVRVKVGELGASAAINDVYEAGSAKKYAFDCLCGVTLVQLRGLYLSYPESSRDADFDRAYSSFVMDRFGGDPAPLPTSSLDKDFEIIKLDTPIKLSDGDGIAKALHVGDQVPITNPFASGAWATENTIYLGDDRFFGHPFGCMTRQKYAENLSGQIGGTKSKDEKIKQVFEQSYIASFSRPKARAAQKPVAGPPVQ